MENYASAELNMPFQDHVSFLFPLSFDTVSFFKVRMRLAEEFNEALKECKIDRL